jgi:hypothetical protein
MTLPTSSETDGQVKSPAEPAPQLLPPISDRFQQIRHAFRPKAHRTDND